jgi:hypothetical protein
METNPKSQLWFARDARGQVAVMDCGRAGPLPKTRPRDFGAEAILAALPILDGAPLEDLRGRLEPSASDQSRHIPQNWNGDLGQVLCFLEETCDAELLPKSVQASARRSPKGAALLLSGARSADLRSLHSQRRCRACFLLQPGEGALALRGIYFYRHLCEAWITGPLGCPQQPASPLRFDDLPEDWRVATLNLARWIDDFSAWPRLQLLDFLPCDRRDSQEILEYLDVHGELQFPE